MNGVFGHDLPDRLLNACRCLRKQLARFFRKGNQICAPFVARPVIRPPVFILNVLLCRRMKNARKTSSTKNQRQRRTGNQSRLENGGKKFVLNARFPSMSARRLAFADMSFRNVCPGSTIRRDADRGLRRQPSSYSIYAGTTLLLARSSCRQAWESRKISKKLARQINGPTHGIRLISHRGA